MSLKKVNKGFILTLLVILGVAIYLLTLETSRGKTEKELVELAKDFSITMGDCFLLPEDIRTSANPKVSEDDLSSLLNDAENNLKKCGEIDSYTLSAARDAINSTYASQLKSDTFLTQIEKDSIRSSVDFKENYITVKLSYNISYSNSSSYNFDTYASDEMIFQKTDGKWTLIYASIYKPMSDFDYYQSGKELY